MKDESVPVVVDFDGTCTTHDFPKVGKDIGAVPVLKKLVANGHKLILFTMRSDNKKNPQGGELGAPSGEYLKDAVKWFKDNDIPLYGIQTNPTQWRWTSSPKAYGEVIIDDAALGCPLIFNEEFHKRPYVDWVKVEALLTELGLIK